MGEAIRLQGLTKDYDGTRALDHLDLSVPSEGCLGFLGPNGAGKTTTIKILTNMLKPTEGRAYIYGTDAIADPRRALASVGAVVETPEFYPELTPAEVLAYLGRLRGMDKENIQSRTTEVLDLVKMSEWRDQRIGKFSKGMKQRIAIAQALLHHPDLLILDEPTSGLDPRGVAEVREVVKGIKAQGHAVFMSSHQLYEVQEVCDRVAIINRGKLLMNEEVGHLAGLRKASEVEIDTLKEVPDGLLKDLHELPGVRSAARPEPTRLLVDLEGGPADRAALLEFLQGQGLRVHSFRETGLALESLYMDLIKESR